MTNGDVFALGIAVAAAVLGLWVALSTIAQSRRADVTVPMRRPPSFDGPVATSPTPRPPMPPPTVVDRAVVDPAVVDPAVVDRAVPGPPSASPHPPPARRSNATPVAVELLTGPDGQWCRITSDDTVPLEVDIFSHRPAGSPTAAPWRHLLLDGAIIVHPGRPVVIPLGPDVVGAIEVVIGGTAPSRPGRSWRGRLVAR